MGTLTLIARCITAVVFAVAAGAKLPNPASMRTTFREFGAGESIARLAILLAPAELLVATGLVIEPTSRWAALVAVALLLVFIAGMLNALRLQRRPDCACFGALRPTPIGSPAIVRNALLLLIAALVVASGPGPSLGYWLDGHNVGVIASAAVLVLVAAGALMFGVPSVKPSGDGTLQLPESANGTRIGDHAPDFDATDVAGRRQSLSSLLAAGRPIVFVFVDAGCGACVSLFPDLGRWQLSLAGRLSIVLVGSGDPERVRFECAQSGITEALFDPDRAMSDVYAPRATPSAVAVTAHGLIAGGPAVGEDAIEDLIRLTLSRDQPISTTWTRTIPVA